MLLLWQLSPATGVVAAVVVDIVVVAPRIPAVVGGAVVVVVDGLAALGEEGFTLR